MTAYQLTQSAGQVRRTSDGAVILFDAGNVDYVAYLAWLVAGNTPDPYVAPINLAGQLAARIEFRAKQLEAAGKLLEAYALRNNLNPA